MQVLQSKIQSKVRLTGSRGPGPAQKEIARRQLSGLSDSRPCDLIALGFSADCLRIKGNISVSHHAAFLEEAGEMA